MSTDGMGEHGPDRYADRLEPVTRWEYAIGAIVVMATVYGLVPILRAIAAAGHWVASLLGV